jgi:hypothetical protein
LWNLTATKIALDRLAHISSIVVASDSLRWQWIPRHNE